QSIEQQAEALKTFLRKKSEMLKLSDQLLQSWFSHDMSAMKNIYQQTLELSGEEDYLVKERNLRWMKVLPGLLQKESQFIAVGALHLAGHFGLVEQLKQSGYTVTPVKL
ncbi:MAG: TraB/GumN family protein, partial [Chitinophagaceae bacterium]